MIPSFGPANAKIMLVFDSPISTQIAKNHFMGGYVGGYLNGLFEPVKELDQVYKTFLSRETIPTNTKNVLQYLNSEGIDYTSYLLGEVNEIQPNVILAAGEGTLEYFTGLSNIRKYRGSILPLSPLFRQSCNKTTIKIAPILPLDEIRKDMRNWVVTQSDLRKAWKYKDNNQVFRENAYPWICRSANSFRNYLDRNKKPEFITTDTEIWNGYIDCASICTDGYEGVCIPLLGNIKITNLELSLIYRYLTEYLNSGIPIVNQNIRFDEYYYRKYGFELGNIVGDTMILSATVYPELPKSLGFLNSLYTDLIYFKDEGKQVHPLSANVDKRYIYCAKDAISTHQVWSGLQKDAEDLNVWKFYNKGPRQFYFTYREIELNGIRFSEEIRSKLQEKYKDLYEIYNIQLKILLGKEINVNSSKQVKILIYDELQLPSQTEIVTRQDGTRYTKWKVDEETLEYLVLNFVRDKDIKSILYLVIYLRKLLRILTYLNLIIHPDGRVRTRYKESGTESGRTSTTFSEDMWYREMPNGKIKRQNMGIALQTVPKHGFRLLDGTILGEDLRSMFVPDNGYTFGEADYKQIEARFVTICCQDWDILERFDKIPNWTETEKMLRRKTIEANPKIKLATKADIHVLTTAQVLSKPEWEVSKWERENKGKRTRHAGNYGLEEYRLSQMAQIAIKEAKLILDKYHQSNPNIQRIFHRIIQELLQNKRVLTNPFGRRRDFFQRITKKVFKIGYSWYPQSTCSDCTKFAMLAIRKEITDLKNFMWLGEFHDGLWWQSLDSEFKKHSQIVKESMETSISFKEGSFPIDFECSIPVDIGKSKESWGEMEEI